ncbi:MAG: 4-(cytidine 5'-diphospho)-2-C-methyl-D-erythritol kinase [Candidatus Omnitrophica bacterium CG11_big_fil_rev_8_21_14_0_20_42_13]|uniref:4-diphosphocytidyl-2-C-methyl-D-erythritol kinase n=1 Tax=Candidatus Ghiorseimicrobium undicola TaxID=1974746 RepID=A0A2H0LZF3_9BACT|nr:MAG: 4-(cytidine 5'-diphospho)-2-C-methyl-D-erythritol kinase [Candidatus Omnitrophica bacterium CG11_big_fil_rev_8_21_14_0_20_42_13]
MISKILLKSPAKINLCLQVLSRRPDGYHNIKTIFERINLYDELEIRNIKHDKIKVSCDNPAIPGGENNIVFITAKLLKDDFNIRSGVSIHIKKRIPHAAGLGGGSSNAASVLLGLNRLWDIRLGKRELIKYAKRIGADVSFFIENSPFALGTQRGDKISSLGIKRTFWHVLAVPELHVSTPLIYKSFAKYLRLTKPPFNTKIILRALNSGGPDEIRPFIFNDLSLVSARRYKIIAKIIESLKNYGLISGMSGSGPSVFGLSETKKHAERAARNLSRFKKLRIFVAKTC